MTYSKICYELFCSRMTTWTLWRAWRARGWWREQWCPATTWRGKHSDLGRRNYTGCSLNIVFCPRILEILPPLPRQLSAAIGCTKNYQPIGVTVHSHCVESFEGLLQRCRRGRGCSELWKNTFFPEHPVQSTPIGWPLLFWQPIAVCSFFTLTFSGKKTLYFTLSFPPPMYVLI